jgi:hypothetical protein
MKYGDKRDYPKIDIYVDGKYVGSTTWSNSCREAKEKYLSHRSFTNAESVQTYYSKG